MAGLQFPNNALFGLGLQQGGFGQGLSDYLRLTLGYDHVVSDEDNFYYYSLTDLSLAVVKATDEIPDEIGGHALSSGVFPTGAWVAGSVSMVPRLDNNLGWLLYAVMGDVSTVTDTKADNLAILGGAHGADSGINSHIFQFQDSDQYFLPWLTIRRLMPHSTSSKRVGETYQDGHVGSLTLTAASAAAVRCDMDMMARVKQSNYVFDYNPSWSAATFDEFQNFATTSCDGHFKVNNVTFDATGVSVTAINSLLPPAQSLIIGSLHPRDFPNLTRAINLTVSFLVSDWDFYVSTFVGSSVVQTDSNIACTVYRADVDVMLASQQTIDGSEPYRIRVLSNPAEDNVAWSIAPVRFMPNRPVVVNATATVLATEGTGWENHPFFIVLQNGQADYALPDP